jgi:hypothetical protein
MEKFSKKSYFYRKTNGLPPAELDNNPDSADKNKARAHGFEELEEGEAEDNVIRYTGIDLNTNKI